MSVIEALKYVSPVGYLVAKTTEAAIENFNGSTKTSNLTQLREEAYKQEIAAKVMQDQAKVEQELAIARRIDNAVEVEIEEYYDYSGKGSLGANANGEGVTIGATGEGRRISKRIIKFKGCNSGSLESISQPEEKS